MISSLLECVLELKNWLFFQGLRDFLKSTLYPKFLSFLRNAIFQTKSLEMTKSWLCSMLDFLKQIGEQMVLLKAFSFPPVLIDILAVAITMDFDWQEIMQFINQLLSTIQLHKYNNGKNSKSIC